MQSSALVSSAMGKDVEPLPYSLDLECPVPWPQSQEAAICQDYPFLYTDAEPLEDFVIRRYLETLWLPESIMPLRHLVYSLRRFAHSPSYTHPLHTALKPLLLSVRSTQEKYQSELLRILDDGGGAGEIEETMMWFAFSKEKFQLDEAKSKESEDAWRKAWMDRLERREVQIQIILYFQLLSLPQPLSASSKSPLSKKRKRNIRYTRGPPSPIKSVFPLTSSVEVAASSASIPPSVNSELSLEDRVEYFMDRLSMWQLSASLDTLDSPPKSERDWMQVFCEDIIEPLFKDRLPEQCALLRTKVFPHSPFSDDSDDSSSPPPPELRTRAKKGKRAASPLRLADLERSTIQRGESLEPSISDPQRRSRSRSVSVSVEEVKARGASRGGVASSKTLFKGEVEMRRTTSRGNKLFKPLVAGENQGETTRQNSATNTSSSQSHLSPQPSSQGWMPQTLAVDTPVKNRVKVEEKDFDVVMDSPDVLLLTSRCHNGRDDEDDSQDSTHPIGKTFVADTPVKKRPRR